MDKRWRRLYTRLQHHIEEFLHQNSKILRKFKPENFVQKGRIDTIDLQTHSVVHASVCSSTRLPCHSSPAVLTDQRLLTSHKQSQVQRVKESGHPSSPTGPNYLSASLPASPAYAGPVPVMLVGNKSDKHHEREVSSQEGQALARELGCDFVEASAKNCINVEKAFFDVVRQLRRQRQNPVKQTGARPMPGAITNPRDRDYDANRPPRIYRDSSGKKRGPKCVIL